MINVFKKIKKANYRHYICLSITVIFILLNIFIFPNAFERIIESLIDLWNSIKFLFSNVFLNNENFSPTVNNLSKFSFDLPFGIPSKWSEFIKLWNNYWLVWSSRSNFESYLFLLTDIMIYLSKGVLFVVPLILLFILLFNKYFNSFNNKYNEDTKPLKIYKWISSKIFTRIKNWLKSFFSFVKKKKLYWKLWIVIWIVNFNFISICLEFFAYYFYFVISFDIISLYVQVYKLLCDLSPMLNFVPLIVWCIIGFIVFDKIRKKIGYNRQTHSEMKNRGFINSRPLVLMIVAKVGKGKTSLATDIALSSDIMLRDKAFEKILENDLKFPFFPWCNLENVMKYAMKKRIVYNLATTKKFIRHIKFCFFVQREKLELRKYIRRHLKKSFNLSYDNFLFDYDFNRYGFTYNDELKIVDVWDIIEIYAQLYFIYIIQSSFIISNYSIRTDAVISDLGNFPLWDTDFFKRDTRLMESYTRHSHILDFDILRLGKKVIENNKLSNSFEFGVIVITEVGKERGNNLELLEKKKKDDFANQKNDLFNYWLKLIRHSSTVDNFPFVRVITDDQRPASWGADAKDLCDVIHIDERTEPRLAMPFFFVEELLYSWIFSKFSNLYYKYRYIRSDNTLFMYLLKNFVSKINKYYTGIYNRFGYRNLKLQVEDGTMNGILSEYVYALINIKVLSKRFSTDCFSDFFMEKALRSEFGIVDLPEFKTEKATIEELMLENAYFMNDILLGLKNNDKE